jgi:hypothetical protein
MSAAENKTDDAQQAPFKVCTSCKHVWPERDDFLSDANVELVGYQPHFEELVAGLLLFNHLKCGSTLALTVEEVQDLYSGEIFSQRLTGMPGCLGLCQHQHGDLHPCPNKCECAWVRRILAIVHEWPKRTGV